MKLPWVLREPIYRRFWLARTTAAVGDAMAQWAPTLAVVLLGGTVAEAGLVLAVNVLARISLMLVGGVVADRCSRMWTLALADAGGGVIFLALGVSFALHLGQVWELVVASALLGIELSFGGPALSGFIAELVDREQLQEANAGLSFSSAAMKIGAPALAGLAVAIFGIAPAFLVAGVAYLIGSGLLLQLPKLGRVPVTDRFDHMVRTGFHEVVIRPWYLANVAVHSLSNLGMCLVMTLGPFIAVRLLGGAASWGVIAGSMSAGLLVGSVISARLRAESPLVASCLSASVLGGFALALAWPSPLAVVILAAASGMAGVAISSTIWNATMQKEIPQDVLSRVASVDWLGSLILLPVGYLGVGAAVTRLGVSTTLAISVGLLVLPGLLLCLVPRLRMTQQVSLGSINPAPVG